MSDERTPKQMIRVRGGYRPGEPILVDRLDAVDTGDPQHWSISHAALVRLADTTIRDDHHAVSVIGGSDAALVAIMDEIVRSNRHYQYGSRPVPIDVADLDLPAAKEKRRARNEERLQRVKKTELSDQKIREHKSWLSGWRTPDEMKRYVDSLSEKLGSYLFLSSADSPFRRNAWIAAQFSKIRHADHVRLINDEWPDFEIEISGRIEQFEATQADIPNRRMGDEYREVELNCDDGISIEHDPVEDWGLRAEAVPEAIRTVCRKKLGKRYSGPNVGLVIYLNLDEYGIRQKEIEACFRDSTAQAKDAFSTVEILWKNKVYRAWP